MAGTGKTTIAYTIALEAEEQELLGATYFFSAQGDEDLKRVNKVISSIAYQLASFDTTYKYYLAQALDENPQLATKTGQKQMQGLIIGPLQRLSRTDPILIVLDALDECGDSGLTNILQLIIGALVKVNIPLRLLLTSRPEPRILAIFQRFNGYQGLILHNIEEAVVQNDIQLFLHNQLAYDTFDPPLSTHWITQHQLELLARNSGKLFVYAVTAVRFIHDNRVKPPHEQLELLLTKPRHLGATNALLDLDGLYLQLLDTVASTRSLQLPLDQIRDVIGAIVLLRDPLSLAALERFLGVYSGYVRCALHSLQSVVLTPDSDDGTARIFHQSFPDFLVDPSRCSDGRFTVNVLEHEKRLVICCFNIMLTGLHHDMANINDPLAPKTDFQELAGRIKPEMNYACRFWVSHLRMVSPGDPDVVHLLEEFSSRCIMWWIEASSILNSINAAIGSSSAAKEWARSSSCAADTISVLNDAYRLLLVNGSLINAYPLQAYTSALPFVPRSTALRRIYEANSTPNIKVLCGQEELWPASYAIWAGHDSAVSSVAVSLEGSQVASGSWDKTVRIWDALSGDCVAKLEGHRDVVSSVAFSPDGSRVVSGSWDKTVRIWDAALGNDVATLSGHTIAVNSVVFSQNGLRIVSSSDDHTVRIWDAVSLRPVATHQSMFTVVNLVAFSMGGWSDSRVWDLVSQSTAANLPLLHNAINVAAFSPDKSRLVTVSRDNTVCVWDTGSSTVLAKLRGHKEAVKSLAFSFNANQVVSGSDDRSVRICDAVSGDVVATLQGHDRAVNSVAFFPDGSQVVSGSSDHTIRIWDATLKGAVGMVKGHNNAINSIAFSPDGSRVVSSSYKDAIRIWDAARGNILALLENHNSTVSSVTFSPNGSRVVSVSDDHIIRLWNSVSGGIMARLRGHSDAVKSVDFSHDGSRVVSGSWDETVRVWDAVSGSVVVTLRGHSGAINSVAFSPDGFQVVSGSWDNTIRIWNIVSGKLVTTLRGHDKAVKSASFSLDGFLIVSSSEDHTVRIWDAIWGDPIAVVEDCRRTTNTLVSLSLSSMANTTVLNSELIDSLVPHTDPPSFMIKLQWLVWNNGPNGPVRLCKLPPRFADDDIPMDVHSSTVALGNTDGVVTVLDVSPVLSLLKV